MQMQTKALWLESVCRKGEDVYCTSVSDVFLKNSFLEISVVLLPFSEACARMDFQ